ncbi:hypothetical protein, partial [Sporisorium scitamineum]
MPRVASSRLQQRNKAVAPPNAPSSARGETCVWRQTPPLSSTDGSQSESTDGRSLANRVAYLERLIRNAGLDAASASRLPEAARAKEQHASSISTSIAAEPSRSSPDVPPVPPVTLAISDLVEPCIDSPNVEVNLHDRFNHQILTATSASSDSCVARSQPLLQLLPQRHRCDVLVDMYFDTLEWIHHPVHVPSFNHWYQQLWKQGLDRLFYQASYDALVASAYLGHHSLAVIQTLILQGLYLNNTGQTTTHHANLGLAIRIANTMGLSSLDADHSQDKTLAAMSASSSSRNKLDTEMGRRIYWSLVYQDCYTASSCNFTYSIQPNQIKTRVFSNLRDDMLVDAHSTSGSRNVALDQGPQSSQNLSDSTPTTSSYHIAKIPFALTARKTVDMHNEGTLTYAAVLQLERENWNHFYSLPHFLRLDKAEQEDGDA